MRASLFAILLLLVPTAYAEGFTAICDADGARAYRHGKGLAGQEEPPEWSSDEDFATSWRFTFDGEENLQVDGKKVLIAFWNGSILTAVDPANNNAAASIWTYAFNLDLQEIVATQVNTYRSIGTGVKARLVKLKCRFSFR